tara:strand:+ start:824 stop:1351 length:528 start_codon:yes stop_codon:yes gene_type:complete
MKFHTCVVNNFLEDPRKVINFSKSVDWLKPKIDENWPGRRSENLFKINKDLHDEIVFKILNLYFFKQCRVNHTEIRFHKIKPNDLIDYNKKETTIHTDSTELAGVIYLNNYNKNNGTRVYDKQHNPIVTVANNFNTLVCYDSKTDHGPTSIDNEERLTIVIFLDKIEYDSDNNSR